MFPIHFSVGMNLDLLSTLLQDGEGLFPPRPTFASPLATLGRHQRRLPLLFRAESRAEQQPPHAHGEQ